MVTTSIFFIVQKSYIFICDDFKLKIHVSILLWSWEVEGGNSLTFLFLRTIVSTACGNLPYPMCLPVYGGRGVHTLPRLHQQWWSFFFFPPALIYRLKTAKWAQRGRFESSVHIFPCPLVGKLFSSSVVTVYRENPEI